MSTRSADPISRRRFLGALARAAAGSAVAPLGLLAASRARAHDAWALPPVLGPGFGRLAPRLPLNAADLTDTVIGDLSRTPFLALPPDFVYTAISITGDPMGDGGVVPGDHDGMACFAGRPGRMLLVRNHELSPGENKFGSRVGVQPKHRSVYDPFNLPLGQAGGGTTTLIVDPQGRLIEHVASLGGTSRNCAGGPTPWASWISCEEDPRIPLLDRRITRRHGYCFEVPAHAPALEPVPLIDAGRFNHEAVAVDPKTRILYETEDRRDGCFYRYVSRRRARRYGHLQEGGSLYAMAIEPNTPAESDGSSLPTLAVGGGVHAVDTRRGVRSFLGQPLPVRWVQLEDVDPFGDTLRVEARRKGASLVSRGEGAWYGRGRIYFVATSGGDDGNGQIWSYDPRSQTVTLLFESPSSAILDNPDNITVARDGTLYLCEDGSGTQFVVGIDRAGRAFPFLRNVFDSSEFAGACFSPTGRHFFVNSQGLGVTFVVFRSNGRPIDAS